MSSFAAELVVDGHSYPVRTCQFEFTQATGERGRVVAKVRHGRLHLSLDVPEDAVLTTWAATAYKPLSGHVTFFETDAQTARETVSFEAGQCIGYHEHFQAGDQGTGAYICQLVIVAEKLVLKAGGANRELVPAASREYKTVLAVGEAVPSIAKHIGGRGSNGFGDTQGLFSGRIYDAESCGGPIQKLDWKATGIQANGIEKIKKHVSRFGVVAANQKMIGRLEKILQNKIPITDYDKRYYTHELREYERYKSLGIPDETDPGYEVWNDVHSATLEDYQINEQAHPLYHPDIMDEDFA